MRREGVLPNPSSFPFLLPTENGVNEVACQVILSPGVSLYDNFLSLGFTGDEPEPKSESSSFLWLYLMYSWLQAVWESGQEIG